MYYFISDTHFGHENILKLCNRPFPDIHAMNEAMIMAWNRRVTGSDTVYILGDLFYRCPDPESILRQLKGRKRLIVGNHDSSWIGDAELLRYFDDISNMQVITDGQRQLTLCHYPLLTWKHRHSSYMIHGHLHANTRDDFFPLIAARERMLNAGVDINDFQPVTFAELVENNARFKEQWRRENT